MEQWQVVSRDTIGYPFRCWIKLTAHMKTIKQERMKVRNGDCCAVSKALFL